MSEFSDWLNQVIEAKRAREGREIKQGQIAQGAGIKPSSLSDLMASKTMPKYETCLKLARYFGEDQKRVLKLAGHEPVRPEPVLKVVTAEIASHRLRLHLQRMAQLPKEAQDSLAKMFGPIIEHVEADQRYRESSGLLGDVAAHGKGDERAMRQIGKGETDKDSGTSLEAD